MWRRANSLANDAIRGEGNFDKAIKNVRQMLSMGIKVRCQTVLSERSQHWIEEFFLLAKEIGIFSMDFARLISEWRAKGLLEQEIDRLLSNEELKLAYENIVKFSKKYAVNTS